MSNSYNNAIINKILTEYQKGNKKTSFEKMKEFIKNNPKDEVARYNFSYMCAELNFIDLAIDNYKKVIKNNPKHWRSKFNLYLIYITQKKYEVALNLINEVLFIKPNFQPALRDKAVVLYYIQKADEGLTFALQSLKQNPKDYIAINTLGLIYMDLKKFVSAEKEFKKAIAINSNYFPSYNNLGRCYSLQNNRELAFAHFNKALKINPNFQEAINNIANYYNDTENYNKAIQYYSSALGKGGNDFEIFYNIAISYFYLKKYNKSEEYYKKSFEINPDDEKLKKNYSFLLLALQKYKYAWNFFESRLGLDEFKLKNDYIHNTKEKLWKSKILDTNSKILVIKEQGIGDEILYGSMYPDFLKKFPNSKIETDSRLISLFARSFGKTDVFIPYTKYSKSKKRLTQFDTIIYAGSLGRLFRNNLSDFPKKNFLTVDKNRLINIKKILNKIDSRKKIGISWHSKNKTYGVDKSLDLNLLLPIIQLKKFTYINLQYGDTSEEIKKFYKKNKLNIVNLKEVDLFNDFESIAALLKNLDLLITVSNSTAHLAGALGVPTWLIKPKNHVVFHYWNQPNNSSPWYPSIKLYPYKKSWGGTVISIQKDLIKKIK